jgi:hypothetical protein
VRGLGVDALRDAPEEQPPDQDPAPASAANRARCSSCSDSTSGAL